MRWRSAASSTRSAAISLRYAVRPFEPRGEVFAGERDEPPGNARQAAANASPDRLQEATGATILRTAVQAPRMNAIAERWIGGCRRELLDRTLAWNQAHLLRILRDYETHHNQHRPHRSLHGAAPLKPLPEPADLNLYRVQKHTHVACLINEYRLVA
jgi:hypothetical protein